MKQRYVSQLPALAQLLRENSRLLYITALSMPKAQRLIACAYFAFWAELAIIPARAQEPLLGHIRLAWWRDGLSGTHQDAHPVLEALRAAAVSTAPLEPVINSVAAILDGLMSREQAAHEMLGAIFALLVTPPYKDAARALGAAVQLAPFDQSAAAVIAPTTALPRTLRVPCVWLRRALKGKRAGHNDVGLPELLRALL